MVYRLGQRIRGAQVGGRVEQADVVHVLRPIQHLEKFHYQ